MKCYKKVERNQKLSSEDALETRTLFLCWSHYAEIPNLSGPHSAAQINVRMEAQAALSSPWVCRILVKIPRGT